MKNLYKSLKKLPDVTRDIITMRANGKKKVVTKNITDRYLLELENGNSIAVTEKDLKGFGINVQSINKPAPVVEKPTPIVENPVQVVEQIEEIEEEIPEVEEELEEIATETEQNDETIV